MPPSASSRGERAVPPPAGRSSSPLDVTGGEERGVDVDERASAPRRLVVDRAGDRLVPGARRPRQEQGLGRGRALRDRLAERAHRRARPEERALHAAPRVGQQLLRDLQLARELGVAALELGLKPLDGQVRVDPGHHLLGLERLRDEVHRPRLEPAHLLARLGQCREEDDGRAGRLGVRLQPATGLVPVDAGHDDVEEDERRARAVRDLQRVLAARRDEQPVAAAVEGLAQQVEVRGLVVDEQDARRLLAAGVRRGGHRPSPRRARRGPTPSHAIGRAFRTRGVYWTRGARRRGQNEPCQQEHQHAAEQ